MLWYESSNNFYKLIINCQNSVEIRMIISDKQVVDVSSAFRNKVDKICAGHGKKSRASREIGITRQALHRFLSTGLVRMETLQKIVAKIEGETAQASEFVKPLIR